MFKALKSLFPSKDELKPDEYTVVTYYEGQEYVSHDGLGLRAEALPPESELDDIGVADHGGLPGRVSLTEEVVVEENGADGSGFHLSSLLSDDFMSSDTIESGSMFFGNSGSINPATGLPMIGEAMDVDGNMYGMSGDDSFTGTGIDDSMSSGFDDSFGSDDSFTFGSDF